MDLQLNLLAGEYNAYRMQRPLSKNKHAQGYDNTDEKQIMNKGAPTVWPIKDLYIIQQKDLADFDENEE